MHTTRSISARFYAFWLANGIWTAAFLTIVPLVLMGRIRDIPYHAYMDAGQRWLTRQPLYDLSNIDGFQYLPQSAAIFSWFSRLKPAAASVLWRGLGWVGLASGEWRLARCLLPERVSQGYLFATCLVAVEASNCLGNGQANLELAALCVHATVELISRRYTRASLILCLGFALKPLMLVPLLVVVALYAQTRWRSALTLSVLAIAPFLSTSFEYASEQYAGCARKLRMCADPDRLFEDLRGLLSTLGVHWSSDNYLMLRLAAAGLTLLACAACRRKLREPLASPYVMGLALGYLMLFNPRTLSTSYVMVTAFAAPLAVAHFFHDDRRTALVLAVCVLAWHINHHVVAVVQYWMNPLACIVFCAVLALRPWPWPWRKHQRMQAAGLGLRRRVRGGTP